MNFSYNDYLIFNARNGYNLPNNFFRYIPIDRRKFNELQQLHDANGISVQRAFYELSKRVGKSYYRKVYPTQSSALHYSENTFPAYRFLLPEVLADDWLAIVDWHKKHSRDHALHQPLTAYIVYQLLGGGDSTRALTIGDSNLLDICVSKILLWDKTNYLKEYLVNSAVNIDNELLNINEPYTFSFWKSLFFETAMVAAIFHDIGYPWQFIGKLNNSLKATNFSLSNSHENAEFIYKRFKNRLVFHPFNGYKSNNNSTPCIWENKMINLITKSLSCTHGFPGAICFLYLNDVIREYPTKVELPFHNFCVDWAALGIMMHDMSKLYNGKQNDTPPDNKQIRIELDRDPLSCIIALSDILQEFERPIVTFEQDNDSSNFIYKHACNQTSIDISQGILSIEYRYQSREGAAIKRTFLESERLEFFDPNYGYIDLSSIGINEVKMNAVFLMD